MVPRAESAMQSPSALSESSYGRVELFMLHVCCRCSHFKFRLEVQRTPGTLSQGL